jgi:hypothetical protein
MNPKRLLRIGKINGLLKVRAPEFGRLRAPAAPFNGALLA